MTTQQWVDAALRLIGYLLSWPVVTLLTVVIFRRRIISTLSALSERARSASVGPISVEFNEMAVEALQDTARQAARELGNDPARLADFLGEQVSKLANISRDGDEESFSGDRILWADDNIGHNRFETHYLQRLGFELETATTTEEALRALDAGRFDLVISDMHRVENGVEEPRAGLKLLREMRSRRHRPPLVFYTSNAALLRENPEISADRAAVADTAGELFNEVRRALRRR